MSGGVWVQQMTMTAVRVGAGGGWVGTMARMVSMVVVRVGVRNG